MKKPAAPKVRTKKQRAADDAALVATGEALAPLAELATTLGVSTSALRLAVQREGAPLTRYLSTSRPVRYCVVDVRAALEAAREELEARRQHALAAQAAERLRGDKRKALKASKAAAWEKRRGITPAAKGAAAPAGPSPRASAGPDRVGPNRAGPEVVVLRRVRGR